MTESQQRVQQWLDDLSQIHGHSFFLDTEGCVTLQGPQKIVIVLQVPASASYIFLTAQLGPVPVDQPESFLYRALTLNLFQHETRGTALAIDPASRQLVLSHAKETGEMDSTEFSNILQNLLEVAEKMQSTLFGDTSPEGVETENPYGMLATGALRA